MEDHQLLGNVELVAFGTPLWAPSRVRERLDESTAPAGTTNSSNVPYVTFDSLLSLSVLVALQEVEIRLAAYHEFVGLNNECILKA